MEKVGALRQLMAEHGLDGYVVPNTDPHQSEYVAEHWRCRKWLTDSGNQASSGLILSPHIQLVPRMRDRAVISGREIGNLFCEAKPLVRFDAGACRNDWENQMFDRVPNRGDRHEERRL